MYIYEYPDWPNFTWQKDVILESLTKAAFLQGHVLGRMKSLGFDLQQESNWHVITQNVIASSAIEGEHLDHAQVRSSVARRLAIPYAQPNPIDRHVDGIVEMMVDALEKYKKPITQERLYGWHAALFPTGFSGIRKISVGKLRTDAEGPMQVVSRTKGPSEIVHFQAPAALSLSSELSLFLAWVNKDLEEHPFIRAAIAHLWFVTLHPFDDGNGRLARAITDLLLSQADQSERRFYSMSVQIQKEKQAYYDSLESTQKGSLDITQWILWFLECLARAIETSQSIVDGVLRKALFWQNAAQYSLTANQRKILSLLLDDFKGNLTSSKWGKMCKVSQDTAGRELKDLVQKNLLRQVGQGRSTHYILVEP